MSDIDINTLAENLRDMARDLQMFIDVQATAVATPRIERYEELANHAKQELVHEREVNRRRISDLQQEFERQRSALIRRAERAEAERDEARRLARGYRILLATYHPDSDVADGAVADAQGIGTLPGWLTSSAGAGSEAGR